MVKTSKVSEEIVEVKNKEEINQRIDSN